MVYIDDAGQSSSEARGRGGKEGRTTVVKRAGEITGGLRPRKPSLKSAPQKQDGVLRMCKIGRLGMHSGVEVEISNMNGRRKGKGKRIVMDSHEHIR